MSDSRVIGAKDYFHEYDCTQYSLGRECMIRAIPSQKLKTIQAQPSKILELQTVIRRQKRARHSDVHVISLLTKWTTLGEKHNNSGHATASDNRI